MKNIIIVTEDMEDSDMLFLVTNGMEDPVRIKIATSGRQLIEELNGWQIPPHLIVLSMDMKSMNLSALFTYLHSKGWWNQTKLIGLTSSTLLPRVDLALGSGVCKTILRSPNSNHYFSQIHEAVSDALHARKVDWIAAA